MYDIAIKILLSTRFVKIIITTLYKCINTFYCTKDTIVIFYKNLNINFDFWYLKIFNLFLLFWFQRKDTFVKLVAVKNWISIKKFIKLYNPYCYQCYSYNNHKFKDMYFKKFLKIKIFKNCFYCLFLKLWNDANYWNEEKMIKGLRLILILNDYSRVFANHRIFFNTKCISIFKSQLTEK